jgi:hypothetical protein
MIIEIASHNEVERKVNIIDYELTDSFINIRYDVIMVFKNKTTTVRGISIFLAKDDFECYKDLPIDIMLNKIINHYL